MARKAETYRGARRNADRSRMAHELKRTRLEMGLTRREFDWMRGDYWRRYEQSPS